MNDALVYIYKNQNDTSQRIAAPRDSAYSNSQGAYTFDSLEIGSYIIFAKAKVGNDSLFAAHSNVQNNAIAAPGSPAIRVDVGTDTMHAPGKIAGRVILQPGDSIPITCYIPGTSYQAITDDSGTFAISSIPAGVYSVYFWDNSGIYQNARDSSITVYPDSTTRLPNKVLTLSTIGAPPAPKGITLQYDTVSGLVTVAWKAVNVADLQQYIVMRRADTASYFSPIGMAPQSASAPSFVDAVYQNASDTASRLFSYEIISEDSGGNRSAASAIAAISVVSPSKLRTVVSIHARPSGNSSGDTVAINEMVKIDATFSNQLSKVQKLVWSVGRSDSAIDSSLFNANSGLDSVSIVFKQTGPKIVYVKSIDASGRQRLDSLIVSVIQDMPKIKYCSPDTAIEFGGAFQCSVSVAHRFGTCTLSVDLNNDGKYVKHPGTAFDTLVNTNTDSAWGTVRIRVTDSHGNAVNDSFLVTINAAPIHDHWEECSPLTNARKWLSACVVNNKMFAIGGCKRFIPPGGGAATIKAVNYVEAYDSLWTLRDTMSLARYDFVSGVYNNAVYVFGGIGSKGATKSIERFDPALNSWSSAGAMPFYRSGAASCVIGSKLYLFGGRVPFADISTPDSICNSIYSFDFTTNTWAELPGSMSLARSDFQALASKGKIYLLGGFGGADNTNDATVLADVEVFDTLTKQCGANPALALPGQRYDFAAVSLNDTIYVIGGINGNRDDLYNDIIMFSPTTDRWSNKTVFAAPHPEGRSGLSAAVLNGKIMLVGGGSDLLLNDAGFAESIVRKYYP